MEYNIYFNILIFKLIAVTLALSIPSIIFFYFLENVIADEF